MMFLGLILIAAAAVLGVGVALESTGPATLIVFGETVPWLTETWHVFLAGALVSSFLIIGMMMTFAGAGRLVRSRRDLRYLREEHEESLTTLEMEKRELQRELARIRRGGGPAPGPAAAPAPQAARAMPGAAPNRPAPPMAPVAPGRSGSRSQVSTSSSFFDRTD